MLPIQPALEAWLIYFQPGAKGMTGNVCEGTPFDQSKRSDKSETKKLSEKLGCKWRRNALRHSFISYRCAVAGAARAAQEAGNSENETRKSYEDAKSEAEGKAYFSINPPWH